MLLTVRNEAEEKAIRMNKNPFNDISLRVKMNFRQRQLGRVKYDVYTLPHSLILIMRPYTSGDMLTIKINNELQIHAAKNHTHIWTLTLTIRQCLLERGSSKVFH